MPVDDMKIYVLIWRSIDGWLHNRINSRLHSINSAIDAPRTLVLHLIKAHVLGIPSPLVSIQPDDLQHVTYCSKGCSVLSDDHALWWIPDEEMRWDGAQVNDHYSVSHPHAYTALQHGMICNTDTAYTAWCHIDQSSYPPHQQLDKASSHT